MGLSYMDHCVKRHLEKLPGEAVLLQGGIKVCVCWEVKNNSKPNECFSGDLELT